MRNSDIMKILSDDFFDSFEAAVAEARHRRESALVEGGIIARVEPSPYGGFRVRAFPAEVYADLVVDGVPVFGEQMKYGKIPA